MDHLIIWIVGILFLSLPILLGLVCFRHPSLTWILLFFL